MNYQKAANIARETLRSDSTPTSSAQIANGIIDTRLGVLRAYASKAASTLGRIVLVNGLLNNVQNGLTADTGSAQSGATAINSSVARFTTVGTAGDSGLLPAAYAGIEVTVINAASNSMDVFPSSGDAINGLSANAAFALAGGTAATFYCTVNGQWNTVSGLAATFSPSVTGTLSLTDSTTPAISLASGKTNTGTITISGKTSGSLILTTADATGQAVTIKPAAQTSGAVTLTTPDFAGVNDTFAFITKAQTFVNKTLTAPVINGATSASGNFDLSGSSGTFLTTTGANTFGGSSNTFTNALTMGTASKGLVLKQGSNGLVGTFVCNGATPVTVSNTNVATTDAIIVSLNTVGGTVGAVPAIKTITGGTGFTIAGTASDTSTYNYAIIKNAA